MAQVFDVIVLGGGIVGASTAYTLAKAGQKTLLIEQFTPGHNRGSSHGDGRVVRFNYSEAIYVEMAMLAYPAWDRLGILAGKPLIQRTGLIEYGTASCAAMIESEANLKQFDLPYERMTGAVGNQRFPQLQFDDQSELIYQADGAVAFATPAVLALWELFKGAGGTVVTGRRVQHLDVTPQQVTLTDSAGEVWQAAKLVTTMGSWSGQFLAQLGLTLPLEVTEEVLAYFPAKTGTTLSHRVGDLPVMIDYHTSDTFYSLPIIDVPGVKVGWHHTGRVIQPDDARYDNPPIIPAVQAWITRCFPYLDPQPIETVSCLYTNTPDYHFVLDRHPDYANVVIGAGFSGHGFKFGSVLGDILASLVLNEEPPLSLETFAISRFSDMANLKKRIGA